jgi:hypothetical protein
MRQNAKSDAGVGRAALGQVFNPPQTRRFFRQSNEDQEAQQSVTVNSLRRVR